MIFVLCNWRNKATNEIGHMEKQEMEMETEMETEM